MNFRQQLYGRYDETNQLMKISNNFYLYKNVNSISKRKIKLPLSPSRKNHINTDCMGQYYVSRNNEIYKKMLDNIKRQPVRLNTNSDKKDIERINNYRKKSKQIEDKLLAIENENYKKRLNMQKGRLNIKNIEDNYQNYHLKEVKRLRRIPAEKSVVLPPISNIMREKRVTSGKKAKGKNERTPSAKNDGSKEQDEKKMNNEKNKEENEKSEKQKEKEKGEIQE